MNALDFTDAKWADGAALLAWLDSLGINVRPFDPSWKRKLERWRAGHKARFYDVDRILVKACWHSSRHVSLHVCQVPGDVWFQGNQQPDVACEELAVAA